MNPLVGILLLLAALPAVAAEPDPLPGWNDTPTRSAIEAFVQRVTTPGNDFVPEAERIAVFDNDGTLWAEKPVYFQLVFAADRVRDLAPLNPDWSGTQPFQGILDGDLSAALAGGERAVLELVMATHAGMTTDEFDAVVRAWQADARHPDTGRRYTHMTYQPMVELLAYLRAHGFKTFIVSGGGIDFMRPFTEEAYGIPPEQVVGTTITTQFEIRADGPVLKRLPDIDFVDDKAGKPVAIQRHIGRRPIAAFGNSDGDLQMLQWTAAGHHPSFIGLVHHTDSVREWAYDRDSAVGRLDRALDEAHERGWTLIDMRHDWRVIHPPQ